MKVVFLGDSISTQRAGIHYFGRQLVLEVIGSFPQHDYHMVCPDDTTDLPVKLHTVPVSRVIPFHLRWRQLFTIPALLNRIKPDLVVELAHFGPFGLGDEIEKVTVIHDLTPVLLPKYHPRMSVIMHKILLPGIIKRASALIVNSEFTKGEILKYYSKNTGHIHVFSPGIEIPRDDSPPSKELNEWTKSPYFLSVGTIEPRKNYVTLINAFDLFCEKNNTYRLVIAGYNGWKSGAFFDAYKKCRHKDRMILTGYVSRIDLLGLYRGAYAFVHGSYYEGFGLPILEAQHFNLPVIASDVPSLHSHTRESALLFDPNDALSLLGRMSDLVEEKGLRKKYAEKTQRSYQEYCSTRSGLGVLFDR